MSTQDTVPPVTIRKQEPDLRRQGALAGLLSALGTCIALALWATNGLLPGLAALLATFILLVALLILGASRAARQRRAAAAAGSEGSRVT